MARGFVTVGGNVAAVGGMSGGSSTPVISSVSASEIGPRYQDDNGGLHTVIQITPTFSSATYPALFTIWIDFDDGNGPQGLGTNPYSIGSSGGSVDIGGETVGTSGVKNAGFIWVPTNPAQTNWTVYAIGGISGAVLPPSGAVSCSLTVASIGEALATDITGAQFLENPATSDILTYGIAASPGTYYWGYYALQFTMPSFAQDPAFWYAAVTIQKGYSTSGLGTVTSGIDLQSTSGPGFTSSQVGAPMHVNGVAVTMATYVDATHCTLSAAVPNGSGVAYEIFNASPDFEGVNTVDPDGNIIMLGRDVTSPALPAGSLAAGTGATVTVFGDNPADWGDPIATNPDGSANLYRTYRFRIYAFSRLASDTTTTGGTDGPTLQPCWSGGADYFDVNPASQPPALDLSQTNLNTVGNNFAIVGDQFVLANLSGQTVNATNMAADAITAANGALAADAVVDSNIASVNVSKLISGTVIFTGTVYLSQGSSAPVIELANTGIFLFGVANSGGTAGLTSDPYVAIESTGIGLYQGSSAASVVMTGGGIALYSVNGNTSYPYADLTSSALTFAAGSSSPTVQINSSGVGLYSVGTNTSDPYATLTSSALTFYYSSTRYLQVNASGVGAYYSSSVYVTVASAGITLVNGNTTCALNSTSLILTTSGSWNAVTINSSGQTTFTDASSATVTIYQGVVSASQFSGSFLCPSNETIQFVGGLTLASSASAGSDTLPSNPAGFIKILIGAGSGTTYKIPYYNN